MNQWIKFEQCAEAAQNIPESIEESKIIKFHIEILKSYLDVCFTLLCSSDPFFLLILLLHHNGWQSVLNSINFTSLWLRRINIPDNKGHQKCSQRLKPDERIWLESWRDWWQWQQKQRPLSSEGDDGGSALCPQTNTLDPWGLLGCPRHKQQHLRQQEHNLTAHKGAGEPTYIVCSCSYSVDIRLNPDQLGCKQGC